MSNTSIVDMTKGVYRRMYAGFIRGVRINSVSDRAEHWFWRLNALADDFGNLDANPNTLHYDASPIRRVSPAQCRRWVKELTTAGLIDQYEIDGEHFIHITNFTDLQPAGRNGKRIQKYKPRIGPGVNPGESKIIQNNPGESCKSMSEHSHTHSHTHTHPHPQAGESNGGGEVLRRLGASKAVIAKLNGDVKPDTVIRHWLTLGKARDPIGALVSRVRSGDVPANQPTPAAIAQACRDGVIVSITLDGKPIDGIGPEVGSNSRGVVIGGKTLTPARIAEAVFA